jgi:hypothetical protein
MSLLCSCGESYKTAVNVRRCLESISPANIKIKSEKGQPYYIDCDEKNNTKFSLLQRMAVIASQLDELYPTRSFEVSTPSGDDSGVEIEAHNPFDAVEEALQELTECSVSEVEQ